jgi:hypothetical protein
VSALSWASAVVAVIVVCAYWGWTLLELPWLRRWVDPRGRRMALALALVAGLLAGASSGHWLGAAVAFICGLQAGKRQWLLPSEAAVLAPYTTELPDGELLAALPDGRATAIRWLEVVRAARLGDTLVVHCGLSRATVALRPPTGVVMPWLPHKSGFYIGDGTQLWDGVDGRSCGQQPDLDRVPLVLCSTATWRARWPAGTLWAPAPVPATKTSIRAVTRSAVGVLDGARWGVVRASIWRPLDDDELYATPDTGEEAAVNQADYYIARWAAKTRNLELASSPQ